MVYLELFVSGLSHWLQLPEVAAIGLSSIAASGQRKCQDVTFWHNVHKSGKQMHLNMYDLQLETMFRAAGHKV